MAKKDASNNIAASMSSEETFATNNIEQFLGHYPLNPKSRK
jgi:hypothetical protein